MTTTTTKPANLFANVSVKETAKKATEKKQVPALNLESKIQRFAELKASIDNMTGELKMIEGDIKATGRDTFLAEFKKGKMRPDNFYLSDQTGSRVMFICMDKYSTVDETKAELLKQFPDLLDEKVQYTINAELVEKHGEILSRIIGECTEIPDEDKPNLISGTLSFSVKKGAIDRLLNYGSDMDTVFELINPICSLKK